MNARRSTPRRLEFSRPFLGQAIGAAIGGIDGDGRKLTVRGAVRLDGEAFSLGIGHLRHGSCLPRDGTTIMTRVALSAKASQGHFYRYVSLLILEMDLFLA